MGFSCSFKQRSTAAPLLCSHEGRLPWGLSGEDSVELNTARVHPIHSILVLGQHSFVGFPEEPCRAPELWLRKEHPEERTAAKTVFTVCRRGCWRCCNHLPKQVLHFARPNCVLLCPQRKPTLPSERYGLWLRMTGSAARSRRGKRGTLTWNLQATMDVTRSTYRKQREGYLHTRSSSCTTSWDGLSLSAPSQSPEHPALDQTPGENAVKGELCSGNLATKSILSTELNQASRKIPFPPLPCQITGEGGALYDLSDNRCC